MSQPIKIGHIINPITADPESRSYFIQQVTLTSIEHAKQSTILYPYNEIEVDIYTAQFPEDHGMVPRNFIMTRDLSTSILDYYEIANGRKLPLIAEILNRLFEASSSDYFIYSNIDIALMPTFYLNVCQQIRSGYDAFTINRRTIGNHYSNLDQLKEMYKDFGDPHRGWDCFVFRREYYPRYRFGNICVGAPHFGLVFLANLMAFASNFKFFPNEHWTFHLGNDRKWGSKVNRVYAKHNRLEALRLLRELNEISGGFPTKTPASRYLRNNINPFRSWIYDRVNSVYIPKKYLERLSVLKRRDW